MGKNKKATISPINKRDNRCFQYAVTVALNNEEIGTLAERITMTWPFINKCKLDAITFPSVTDGRKNMWE